MDIPCRLPGHNPPRDPSDSAFVTPFCWQHPRDSIRGNKVKTIEITVPSCRYRVGKTFRDGVCFCSGSFDEPKDCVAGSGYRMASPPIPTFGLRSLGICAVNHWRRGTRSQAAFADTEDERVERRFFGYQPKDVKESLRAYCPQGKNREGKHPMTESFLNRVVLAADADEIIESFAVT